MSSKVFILFSLLALCNAQYDPYTEFRATVQLFEWPWGSIATECENFLAPAGYGGVQISPPNEVIKATSRPWWERYQPVSYALDSRSGSAAEFDDMVTRCRNVDVSIYVDVVLNHMTGTWPNGTETTGSSTFDSESQSYPGVPYAAVHFNDDRCNSSSGNIDDQTNADEVRYCKLDGQNDLDQGDTDVRDRIIEYLNDLISRGVAGFRIDAAKNMLPSDLQFILDSLNDLRTPDFPAGSRPFITLEVMDLDLSDSIQTSEYTGLGLVTEFWHAETLKNVFGANGSLNDLQNYGEDAFFTPSEFALVFVDDHDLQRVTSDPYLTYKTPKEYRMAIGFGLTYGYGYPRIMSSYEFTDIDAGPPANVDGDIEAPIFGPDGLCINGWVCEHRWRQIFHMVEFLNDTYGTPVQNWWSNGDNQIAFGRGSVGFAAFNNEGVDMNETLQTGLPPGPYCDMVSGNFTGSVCTGKVITVADDGTASIEILIDDEDAFVAYHVWL